MAVLSDVIEGAKAFAAESPALSAGGILVLFLVTVTYLVRTRSSRLNFPVVGVPGQRMGKKELTEGVRLVSSWEYLRYPFGYHRSSFLCGDLLKKCIDLVPQYSVHCSNRATHRHSTNVDTR